MVKFGISRVDIVQVVQLLFDVRFDVIFEPPQFGVKRAAASSTRSFRGLCASIHQNIALLKEGPHGFCSQLGERCITYEHGSSSLKR